MNMDLQEHDYKGMVFMVLYALAPPNLVCDSMSTIGIWVLRAPPPWREPPPETLISRY